MDELTEVLARTSACTDHGVERVVLDFRHREKSRQRAVLASGEAIAIRLPRGTTLRGGDVLGSASGRRVAVVAAAEPVSTVRCADAVTLARVAYHLGNRHVRLQVGDGWVRYLADHVLDAMVRGLGAEAVAESAPFEPEAGAYHTAAHSHDEYPHGVEPAHGSHGHSHGHSHAG